ncbi:MAG: peptidoglycan DD-metalloendopeptidase family protein [Spirochaetota bacterium]
MKKISSSALILAGAVAIFTAVIFAHTPVCARDYLISGQNTVQKIYYAASSDFSRNHSGKMAMDSDASTSWISAQTGKEHWLEIDFGTKRLMSTIIVRPGRKDNYRTLRSFTLQFYYQNRWFDFRTIDCEKDSRGKNKYQDIITIDCGGVDASKFRILVPADGTYDGTAAVAEVEAWVGSGKIKYYDDRLRLLSLPVYNGYLPEGAEGYPNANRSYRGGTHHGLDIFYYHADDSYAPIPVTKETPICAAGDGIIIRADFSYTPLSEAEWKTQSAYYQKNPHTFDARSFGGQQVWIDHQNGIVTAYNHLSSIDSSVKPGAKIKKGAVLGKAGNSGLLGEAQGKDYGTHLHFEIWVDSYYLGYGMNPEEVKNYVRWIFFPLQ